ncbi:hypothetical protein L7G72_13935 [Xenorhabdus bovienii]|uniref:hypothetical protein n=1 Tax=Xenorhabdus bovienii TaxID=40576 RepID=UPI001EDE7300|nr:hypothetical protein [Xenorhabdus bovienii]MCG3462927.1 hypothetical protein [Xenorhabdus bovienii]
MLHVADYPQMKQIAWYLKDDAKLDEKEALAFYERNWKYVEPEALEPHEKALIDKLVKEYGGGILNV